MHKFVSLAVIVDNASPKYMGIIKPFSDHFTLVENGKSFNVTNYPLFMKTNRITAKCITIVTIIFISINCYSQYIPTKNGNFLLTRTNKKYSNGDVFEMKYFYDGNKNLTCLGENFKQFIFIISNEGIDYNDSYQSKTYYQYESDNKLKSMTRLAVFEKGRYKHNNSSDSTYHFLNFFYNPTNIRIEGQFFEISNCLIFKENEKTLKCYFFKDNKTIDEFIYKNDSKSSEKTFFTGQELDFGNLTLKNGEASLHQQIKDIIKTSELESTANYYYNSNKNLTRIDYLTDTLIYKTIRFFYSKVLNGENEQIINIPTVATNMGKFLPDSIMYTTRTHETNTFISNGTMVKKDTTFFKVETDIFNYTFDKDQNLIKAVRYKKHKSDDFLSFEFIAAFNRGGLESDTTDYYYEKSKIK